MNIQANYGNSAGNLCYGIQRRSIYLYSGALDATTLGASTITNGLRLRYRSYPADFPDMTDNSVDMSVDPTTTTFGFPRQFHELLARRCGIVWKAQHPGAVLASQLEAMYPNDLEEKLQAMDNPDLTGETIASLPPATDNHFGYDL